MFSRRINSRIRIGRFLGIDLFIHWTFWLLFFGVGLYAYLDEYSFAAAGLQMGQIGALFLCVTLHEYGHAMMARRFKVETVDITLLPIGGLARLERMPRIPHQELLVAIAGPAVNVVIAGFIAVGLGIAIWSGLIASVDRSGLSTYAETLLNFNHPAGWLFFMNVSLVLFNMVPAFPMDGGRVLRSILAMFLEYRLATRTAARIGLVAAVGLFLLGWHFQQPVVILISVFIGYAGWAEARQVEMSEAIRGIRIEEATVDHLFTVSASEPLASLVEMFNRRTEPIVPVIGVNQYFLGMLELDVVSRAVSQGRWDSTAADLMTSDVARLRPEGLLDQQISGYELTQFPMLPVVDGMGRLAGVFDTRSMAARVTINRHLQHRVKASQVPAEALLVEPQPPGSLRDSYL